MSRLRSILIDRYAEHYARVFAQFSPDRLTPRQLREADVMYGELVAELPAGSRVLDLGCGTGALLAWLQGKPGIVPVGVDSSPSQVEVAKRCLPGISVTCEDGLTFLRRHPGQFGGIFCTDVLEHIPGNDQCLEWAETARDALVPGGFFFCRMPNGANLLSGYTRYMDLTHERIFTSTSVIQFLEAAGFERCRVVPVRLPHLGGRLRLGIEAALHRAVFRLCGMGLERVFTYNVNAVGYRPVAA